MNKLDFNSKGFHDAIMVAVEVYAEFTGMEKREVLLACQTVEGPIFESVAKLVFAGY